MIYRPDWTNKRINFIVKHYGDIINQCSSLINMAANQGDLSAFLVKACPSITSVINEEGRSCHIETGKTRYLNMNWSQIDFQTCDLNELPSADIVLNFGLLYHLSQDRICDVIRSSILRANKILFLESIVLDSTEGDILFQDYQPAHKEEQRSDQGIGEITEARPSIRIINRVIEEIGCNYDFIGNPELDSHIETHGDFYYSWPIKNDKCKYGRKMWVIYKG